MIQNWQSEKTYKRNDVVTLKDKAYFCLQENTDFDPRLWRDYWAELANPDSSDSAKLSSVVQEALVTGVGLALGLNLSAFFGEDSEDKTDEDSASFFSGDGTSGGGGSISDW